MRQIGQGTIGLILGVALWGCGTGSSSTETYSGPDSSVAQPDAQAGKDSQVEAPIIVDGESDVGLLPEASCFYDQQKATRTQLNLYLMLDKSSSMQGSNWTSALQGLESFLNDPASAGIYVAINFFPRAPDSVPVCDQRAYQQPRVPFGELPQNASALLTALQNESPDGFGTPIYPALGGALLEAMQFDGPNQSAAVLLVTDGQPQGPATSCAGVNPEDPQVIAQLAAAGLQAQPPIRTFVIGLPGANQSISNQIAAAGGGSAILVGAGQVQAEFVQALSAIRGKALPCEFQIPSEVAQGQIDFDHVNVIWTDGTSHQPTTLPQSPQCDQDGWRYDNPTQPTRILLCPTSCQQLQSDLGAEIEIMLGCATIIR